MRVLDTNLTIPADFTHYGVPQYSRTVYDTRMDENDIDFEALNRELNASYKRQGNFDVVEQVQKELENAGLTAARRIRQIAEHSDNEQQAMKASMYILDKLLGNKPLEHDPTKALLERLGTTSK